MVKRFPLKGPIHVGNIYFNLNLFRVLQTQLAEKEDQSYLANVFEECICHTLFGMSIVECLYKWISLASHMSQVLQPIVKPEKSTSEK